MYTYTVSVVQLALVKKAMHVSIVEAHDQPMIERVARYIERRDIKERFIKEMRPKHKKAVFKKKNKKKDDKKKVCRKSAKRKWLRRRNSFEFRVSSFEFRVSSFEFRVSSFEFRVSSKFKGWCESINPFLFAERINKSSTTTSSSRVRYERVRDLINR